ncbi:MAG: M23 family metallopeptidase [Patescibacteria group bacterium]|jgi:murein DD-endopeptidase MepM/ murein hydrolase activator NlpD
MKNHRLITILALILAFVVGCSKLADKASNPQPKEAEFNDVDVGAVEVLSKRGAKMIVAWPFGSLQLKGDWIGWDGPNTPGSTIGAPFCNGRLSTHSGAEYYARDLNQINGLDYGIQIFAGFGGRIIYAGWQNGYGYTVVVYDPIRHVAIRYAHLSYIYSRVYVGKNIPAHFFLGRTGNSGNSIGTHLHIVGYENINDNNGHPVIPTLCDSEYYACQIDFYWWQY